MTKAYNVSSRTKKETFMEHRIGMEIRVLSKYMGRYLDDIHGIDCMLSGPQGLILIYLCENDEEVYQKDIEKYFNIRRSTGNRSFKFFRKERIYHKRTC